MHNGFDEIRLRDLSFFDRLATLGSLTAAAKEFQVPKATASRWLAAIEERVGQVLVRRTTRRIALTERGEAFVDRAREILVVAQAARLATQAEALGGRLRISVPVPLGRTLAGPVIAAFRRRLPGVRLEIRLQNERVDLVRDGIDLAIRGGELPDSDLVARKLSTASMRVYVSTRYRGESPRIIPLIAAPGDEERIKRAGIRLASGNAAALVDDRTAVAEALVLGAGAGLLPSFLGEAPRMAGALFLLDGAEIASMPVHAVYHPSSKDDVRLQILIEEIAGQLQRVL